MKKFICSILACVMLLCSLSSFAAYELPYGGVTENPILKDMIKEASRGEGDTSLMYPPEKHPYIFVNDEYIKFLKEHKDDEVYKQAYSYQITLAKKEMPEQPTGGILSAGISNQMVGRAFAYMMGEVDKAHAKETIDYVIEYCQNAKTKETYSINIYKDYGNQAIQCGALVYDWCYDAMTEAQKGDLGEAINNLMYSSDQPCRPDNIASAWSDINGKSVGQPLIYMSIGCSAIYHEFPAAYELMMQKIQGTMAEISKIYGEAGALTDGSTAYTREYYTYYVELLFQRMGHDITEKYGKQLPLGYKLMYGRLPYGTHLKTGDSWTQVNYAYGAYSNSSDIVSDMGMLQVMFEDPYLKHFYQRDNNNESTILGLLARKGYHEAKTPDDLPLAFEAKTPRSEIIHKTSWQEGLDSPQVTAYLNMNNRRSGDHDHAEHGTFQLHYKGPLSISQGNYFGEAWGGPHWRNYLTRTISKNGMLAYNPNEVYMYGAKVAETNDGGQKMAGNKAGNGYVIADLDEHMSEWNNWTKTESTYMGPNEMTPAFSFIKGDLTGAYQAAKMDNYKRSMVFADTFNADYPGVLVVFDRMVTKKATYPKTWLLQAVAEPHVEGNKITIVNTETEPNANGKLVNFTLLPEKTEVKTVGGINKYVDYNGKEWPVDGTPTGTNLYQSGWRAEITPVDKNTEDIFLNAMYVADADRNLPDVEFKKEESDEFIGVSFLDRQVMFSKTGQFIDKEFSLMPNCIGMALITDLAPGKWKVHSGVGTFVYDVKEGDNAIVIKTNAAGRKFTFTPVDASTEETPIDWPEAAKEKIGDFSIKVGTTYQYLRQPTKLVNDVPYIPESFITYSTASSFVREGNNMVVTCPDGAIMTLTAGSGNYTISKNGVSTPRTTDNAPFIDENGVFYFNHEDGVGSAMYLNISYLRLAKSMAVTLKPAPQGGSGGDVSVSQGALEGVNEAYVVWPLNVYASTDDGNVPTNIIDRDLSTRWSSIQGDEEWCTFQMGDEPVEMTGVQIAWYNGDKRNWKFDIQISDDGDKWTDVLKGMKSAGKSMNVETFKFPSPVKAKYIRYLGHGEEVTSSFYNSVTEFVIINENNK